MDDPLLHPLYLFTVAVAYYMFLAIANMFFSFLFFFYSKGFKTTKPAMR